MRCSSADRALGALLALFVATSSAHAQTATASDRAALVSWIDLDVAPGRERPATDFIRATDAGWTLGPLGSLVKRAGSGMPRRVIACALDAPGFVVSEIRPDGYLRLQYDAIPPSHPLWDQFFEGQRIVVHGRTRDVPGAVAVRSAHLIRGAAALGDAIRNVSELWVDVGARSAAEVARLGIANLDAVGPELRGWSFADRVAGPFAAQRIGCASVAAAASKAPARGENVYVLAAQSSFGWLGLGGVIARLGAVDTLVLLDPALAPSDSSTHGVVRRDGMAERTRPVPHARNVGAIVSLNVAARDRGSLVESVTSADAATLRTAVAIAARLGDAPLVVRAVTDTRSASMRAARTDSLASIASLLGELADAYGVSGHEGPVRDIVRAKLPAWARPLATVDTAGNVVVAVGPDRDTVVVVAHMDEVGFEVTRIERDGSVRLANRGGALPTMWEGRPALLHLESSASGCTQERRGNDLPGIFAVRSTTTTRWSGELTAWFGVDSATLAACGARAGTSVTAVKRAARIGETRFTGRAMDDRAGSTALLLAAQSLDPSRLKRKVIFAWATREEIGLQGAAAIAARLGTSPSRVHAVDTFVSSDSPIESSRFAALPLGKGAVVRALDNASVSPPEEVDRVVAIARANRIPIQVGTTNGGTDGTPFTAFGVPNTAISWPGRYSHSPVEVADLLDVRALSQLIRAIALAP